MRRSLLALTLAAVGLLLADRASISIEAESLDWATKHQRIITFPHEALTDAQITELQIALGRAMRQRASELPGWKCLGPGFSSDNPPVVLRFDAGGPDALQEGDRTYRIMMSLTVKGLGTREAGVVTVDLADPEYERVAGSSDPVVVLSMAGRVMLDDLMKQVSPCTVKARLRIQAALEKGATRTTHTYTGDLTLNLREDGSFETRGALAGQIESSHFGCPLSLTVPNLTLEMAGGLRGRGDTLAIERLTVGHQPLTITVANCTLPGGAGGTLSCAIVDNGTTTGTCDVRVAGGGGTFPCCEESFTLFGVTVGSWDSGLTVALADHAAMTLPRPVRANRTLASWEASLELSYGDTSPSVALAPRSVAGEVK